MPWNEPGGKRPPEGWEQERPADLDQLLRLFREKLGPYFGGEEGGSRLILLGIAVILLLWLLSGFHIIQEGKRGVVTRFGRYVETIGSGLHWRFPAPIEQVEVVDVTRRWPLEIGYREGLGEVPQEALMLTGDENIVRIHLSVHYVISDPVAFLFNIKDPEPHRRRPVEVERRLEKTLRDVTESALREVVGQNTMDFVLTEGRSEVALAVKALVQKVLDSYGAGIAIEAVNLVDAQPPEEVQDAFEDAIRAREDRERFINEAKAYANQIIPKARGEAARILEEARAYRERVVAKAEGEANRFLKVVKAYEAAPEVTRKRLYLETLEEVLGRSRVLLVDLKEQPLLYLPVAGQEERKPPPPIKIVPKEEPTERPVLRHSERGRRGRGLE